MLGSYLTFKETVKIFSKVVVLFYFPTSSVGEPQFLHTLAHLKKKIKS